jgi:multidrug resistance efflux pump
VQTVTVGRGGLEAQVENARAALRLAEIDLANTVIRAPQAGQVSELGVRLGQYVTAGTQLMFLVPDRVWGMRRRLATAFLSRAVASGRTGLRRRG